MNELLVFQRACEGADAVFALCRDGLWRKDRDLAAQMNRASIRVVSDIAEGFEQSTDRHFAKYLYDARGSAAEIRAQLRLGVMRACLVPGTESRANQLYVEVGRMLTSLIEYLERGEAGTRRGKRGGAVR